MRYMPISYTHLYVKYICCACNVHYALINPIFSTQIAYVNYVISLVSCVAYKLKTYICTGRRGNVPPPQTREIKEKN